MFSSGLEIEFIKIIDIINLQNPKFISLGRKEAFIVPKVKSTSRTYSDGFDVSSGISTQICVSLSFFAVTNLLSGIAQSPSNNKQDIPTVV